MLSFLLIYSFSAFVVYAYIEEIKTALLWPYTLVVSIFKSFSESESFKGGKINFPPAVEFIIIFILAIASIAISDGWLELFIIYLFTMFVVNSNIRNLPESLLWPFIVIKFVFVKLFAIIRIKRKKMV